MLKSELADKLARGLRPVRPRNWLLPAIAWITGVAGTLLIWMIVSGGPRPQLASQLAVPRFAIEVGIGVVLSVVAIAAALRLSIPGRGRAGSASGVVGALFAAWAGSIGIGLVAPLFEPSMAGKRELCNVETVLLALVPLAVGLYLAARLAPLSRAIVGGLLGVAAASVPALLMQLFCMYEAGHALTHHIAPIALVAASGAALGRVALPR